MIRSGYRSVKSLKVAVRGLLKKLKLNVSLMSVFGQTVSASCQCRNNNTYDVSRSLELSSFISYMEPFESVHLLCPCAPLTAQGKPLMFVIMVTAVCHVQHQRFYGSFKR